MTVDLWGGIWLGTPFNGLIYLNPDAYFAGHSSITRFMEADGLASNNVLALAADQEGYVLIGTAAGTNIWTGSQLLKLREDYQPIGLRINSIFVDELGNRWFATESGISLLKQGFVPWNTEGWVHFVGNSANVNRQDVIRTNIPESNFYGVFADYQGQRIFLSSDNGLFISNHFPGLAAARSAAPLIAFPNPAITGDQNTSIKIKNILPNSVVKVLTVNGKLVRELNPDRKDEFSAYWAVWDGRDENGALVPTGVYIVYSISDNGESQIGKIFLIQK
ncbi:MAG: hypothetical protein D6732_14900 [Methanobacteriota archaeon]|nr:MAG: hypothetical protein D6732_14900 [Euryarchaeota archaeon]